MSVPGRILTASLFLTTLLSPLAAGFAEGQKLFAARCASCHIGPLPVDQIKENFFKRQNKLLKLEAPTVNMLAWAITEGPRKIGDPSDPEMRQAEIEEYLREVLEHPESKESICDSTVMRYYAKRQPVIKLGDKELANLAAFFLGYKAHAAMPPQVKKVLSKELEIRTILDEAKKEGKIVILEASSPTCHYCEKMDKEVIQDPEVARRLQRDFILVEVNVDDTRLPLGLDKVYRQITPSFFFLTPQGRLLAHYPGSWNKSDFTKILKTMTKESR